MAIKMTKKGNAKDTVTGEKYTAVRKVGCDGCAFPYGSPPCLDVVCGPGNRTAHPDYKVRDSVIFVKRTRDM